MESDQRRGTNVHFTNHLFVLTLLGFIALILSHRHTDNTMVHHEPSVVAKFLQASSVSLKKTMQVKVGHDKSALNSKLFHRDAGLATTDDFIFKPGDSLVAGLNCDAYGGPSEEIAKEMVYWKHIPSDCQYVSPFKKQGDAEYITFELGSADWNEVRVAMETVIAMCIAMGRTLVLPPKQAFQDMSEGEGGNGKSQQNSFSLTDFFPLKQVNWEHPGLDIVTMQEFLQREAMNGNLRDSNGRVNFPPFNISDWDGAWFISPLYQWLRNVTQILNWDPTKCIATFPSSTDPQELQILREMKSAIGKTGGKQVAEAKLHPVNAPASERMEEILASRNELCFYEGSIQTTRFLHVPNGDNIPGNLLQARFFKFLFFYDWRHDLWMKRFVRDHLRYNNVIQCAAARVVRRLRERARNRGDRDGNFDSFLIRRADLNVSDAKWIFEAAGKHLVKNATVYIASDQTNVTYFDPLKKHYDVVFLKNFMDELYGVNTNFYGIIDQLVASRSRVFSFGNWSTVSEYINQLRGYHDKRVGVPSYEH